jgi:hypothetical protein
MRVISTDKNKNSKLDFETASTESTKTLFVINGRQ